MGGEAKGKHVFPGQLQRETLQENKQLQLSNLDVFITVKVKDQIMLRLSFQCYLTLCKLQTTLHSSISSQVSFYHLFTFAS